LKQLNLTPGIAVLLKPDLISLALTITSNTGPFVRLDFHLDQRFITFPEEAS
jgi:hypothetical protein